MLRRLGFHSDEMALALTLWLCSLPLVVILVVPFFGLKVGGLVALVLLVVAMAMCWGACGWKLLYVRSTFISSAAGLHQFFTCDVYPDSQG